MSADTLRNSQNAPLCDFRMHYYVIFLRSTQIVMVHHSCKYCILYIGVYTANFKNGRLCLNWKLILSLSLKLVWENCDGIHKYCLLRKNFNCQRRHKRCWLILKWVRWSCLSTEEHTIEIDLRTSYIYQGEFFLNHAFQLILFLQHTWHVLIINVVRGYFAGLRVTKRNEATVLLTLTLFQTPTLILTLAYTVSKPILKKKVLTKCHSEVSEITSSIKREGP
jgi:hypothetical protein